MTERVLIAPVPEPEHRVEIDAVLCGFLEHKQVEMARLHPAAATLASELLRLVGSGGKRLRPALGYWGYRAAGGVPDGRIIRAAASLELFHTFALIHDDLMDDADERRGIPSIHAHVAVSAAVATSADPRRAGISAAMLIGDIAAVWADELLVTSGFDASRVTRALVRAYDVRQEMAVGQFLDVTGQARVDEAAGRLAANLKGGRYTVTGPLLMGAELARDETLDADLLRALQEFGEPLGEAFQLQDDLHDADAGHGATARTVRLLVERAQAALAQAGLDPVAAAALFELSGMVCA